MKKLAETLTKNRGVQALVILLVAAVAADAGFYFLRTAPAASRVAALQEEIEGARKEFLAKDAEYRVYNSYDSGRASLGRFRGLLPRRSDYTEVIGKVYRLAKDDGMKSESFGTEKKEVQQEGDLVQLSFSMPISGSYPNVRKFIHDVETSPLFLNIDNLGLAAEEKSGDVNLTIGLSTYAGS